MKHVVRTATKADIAEITRLKTYSYRDTYFSHIGYPMDVNQFRYMCSIYVPANQRSWGNIAVVDHPEDTSKLIGYCLATKGHPYANPDIKVATIQATFVDPEFRNLGIGGRLVANIELWAKKAGCIVFIANVNPEGSEHSQKIYEKLGMVPGDVSYVKRID